VKDSSLCPVENLKAYVSEVEEMGVDLSVGFLFRTLDPSHSKVIDSPVSSSGMGLRLKGYLKDLGILRRRNYTWYKRRVYYYFNV
jgi:hypothetical protein